MKRPGTMSDDERAEIGRPYRAIPLIVPDDITGRYEGEELARMRASRPTEDRIAKLEQWKDQVTPVIHGVDAKVDTLLTLAAKSDAERERRAAREAEERTAKDAQNAQALASKRSHVITVIKTLGVAAALVAAAIVGRGVS